MVPPAATLPTRPPVLVPPCTAPLAHAAATRPALLPTSSPAVPWALRTRAFGSPSARTSALPRSAANSPAWLRLRFTSRFSITLPLPSKTALKCVVSPGVVAGPMGSQPLPPL